jgi:hypothetical protein
VLGVFGFFFLLRIDCNDNWLHILRSEEGDGRIFFYVKNADSLYIVEFFL